MVPLYFDIKEKGMVANMVDNFRLNEIAKEVMNKDFSNFSELEAVLC